MSRDGDGLRRVATAQRAGGTDDKLPQQAILGVDQRVGHLQPRVWREPSSFDDRATVLYRHFEFRAPGNRWLCRRLANIARAVGETTAAILHPGQRRSRVRQPSFPVLPGDGLVAVDHLAARVMTDISSRDGPELLVPAGDELDALLGPLAAYLHALEARVAALERRLAAVPLMTAADAARYARVNVETILRAVRAGELPVAGYVGRSPRISRDALVGWLATRSPSAAPVAREPRRGRARKASDAVEAAWQRLG
jgi:excisionase family DNA binding protein